MTDDEFFAYITDKVNLKRREQSQPEITEAQVREGLDVIAAVSEHCAPNEPRYCICADPEYCDQAIPGYICRAGLTAKTKVEDA